MVVSVDGIQQPQTVVCIVPVHLKKCDLSSLYHSKLLPVQFEVILHFSDQMPLSSRDKCRACKEAGTFHFDLLRDTVIQD
jgi:hypothetical protein